MVDQLRLTDSPQFVSPCITLAGLLLRAEPQSVFTLRKLYILCRKLLFESKQADAGKKRSKIPGPPELPKRAGSTQGSSGSRPEQPLQKLTKSFSGRCSVTAFQRSGSRRLDCPQERQQGVREPQQKPSKSRSASKDIHQSSLIC